jgi:hypothetical protein
MECVLLMPVPLGRATAIARPGERVIEKSGQDPARIKMGDSQLSRDARLMSIVALDSADRLCRLFGIGERVQAASRRDYPAEAGVLNHNWARGGEIAS